MKQEVDVTAIAEKLKRNLEPLAIGPIKVLRGQGKNTGKFMLHTSLDIHRDIRIIVDVNEMFRNKNYFDGLTERVYQAAQESDRRRFEACRITV